MINIEVAKNIFDIAFYSGANLAGKVLQDCLNQIGSPKLFKQLLLDGDIGPMTFSALKVINDDQLLRVNLMFALIRLRMIHGERYDDKILRFEVSVVPEVTTSINDNIFDEAYVVTGGHEGGYSNNPRDSGGETWSGIARKKHPNAKIWKIIDAQPVKSTAALSKVPELPPLVKEFYYNEFWLNFRCDEIAKISPATAMELYDSCVNTGSNGAKFLQRALNRLNVNQKLWPDIKDDGVIGNTTIEMVRKCCADKLGKTLLFKCQNGEQYTYYSNLRDHEYWRGWFART